METKGLLTTEQEAFIAGLLDNAINFKNPILEAFDATIFQTLIKVIDDNLMERIPEGWQNPLEGIITAAMEENYELAATLASDLLNSKIDIPGLDEISEQLIFNAILQLIVGLILDKINQAKA